MKRIFLFLVTNLAVSALLSAAAFLIETVFGVRLGRGGLGGLPLFAAICGMGGAFISLALSWYSRQREYRADRGGANLTCVGHVAGALELLKRDHGGPLPPRLQAFGISTAARVFSSVHS